MNQDKTQLSPSLWDEFMEVIKDEQEEGIEMPKGFHIEITPQQVTFRSPLGTVFAVYKRQGGPVDE